MAEKNNDNSLLGYQEKVDALSIRIKAHKEFSNFSLENWLDVNLPFKEKNVILDIGCGSGNLLPVYANKIGEKGAIVGIDQSPNLLAEASKLKIDTPFVLLEWDMNNRLPFMEKSFDYVISTFAIYYANDVRSILEDIKRVLKLDGQFLLIGPNDNNAAELYQFNKKIFGFDRNETADRRTNRLNKEFYPIAASIFKNVSLQKIDSKLIFPNKHEFVQYYMATLLFEESIKQAGFRLKYEEIMAIDLPSLEVSKEMIALWGTL